MSDQSKKEGQPTEDKPDSVDTTLKSDEGLKAETTSMKREDLKSGAKSNKQSSVPSKRKAETKNESSKVPRRSARGAQQPPVDPVRMVQFLLSSSSTDLCRPKDELEDLKKRGADIRTYSSSTFTPFEELICAVILSRPISHALGLRSIRTIFNDPWNFTTPKALREAGSEGRRKALDEARTQHRQKTADELGYLAEVLADKLGDNEEDVEMGIVRKECEKNADKGLDIIKSSVKGMGKTGIEIFRRRIQGVWLSCYPFVDHKTASSLEKFGLPSDAEGLQQLLEEKWSKLNTEEIKAGNEDEKKRKAFVRLLEHAVGADLENNVDGVKAQAA